LLAVAVVDPVVDDWLCAAISALIVSGEICEQPLVPDEGGVEPAEVAVLLERSNGLAGSLAPDCDEADFDDVSDLRASSADIAALRAGSMGKTPTRPRGAAFYFHPLMSKRRAIARSQ